MNFILIGSVRNKIAKVILTCATIMALLLSLGVVKQGFGIEFTGGVVYTLDAPVEVSKAQLSENSSLTISGSQASSTVQMVSESVLTETQLAFIEKHKLANDTIGASLGQELIDASIKGMALAFFAVMIYLSVRYNAIMAGATLVALLHDIVFTVFVLALFDVQMSSIVVGALLAIIGYSINDSVVTLDRVRELIRVDEPFPVQSALEMTLQRNINTAVSTLIVIVALLIFGGSSMQAFAMTMFIGVGVGMFSSLTIVPFLVTLKERTGALTVARKPSLEGEL
ncbi:protein translocase subunit SecF [Vibrio coralliirubri]|uniref:protein translocase subunit SecF n=1 Tax=Vibrio coralliirubri TaxID=1516159 RepID=UPI0022842ABD|nr:protein translocase subunit SecF [Vibrio coralliirubri]MCY9861017.1 protein translocase subunit SecF [Vibrio coralliirubri]